MNEIGIDMPAKCIDSWLQSCLQEMVVNGIDSCAIPDTLKDWVSGRVLRALPKLLCESLIQYSINENTSNPKVNFEQSETADSHQFTFSVRKLHQSSSRENGLQRKRLRMSPTSTVSKMVDTTPTARTVVSRPVESESVESAENKQADSILTLLTSLTNASGTCSPVDVTENAAGEADKHIMEFDDSDTRLQLESDSENDVVPQNKSQFTCSSLNGLLGTQLNSSLPILGVGNSVVATNDLSTIDDFNNPFTKLRFSSKHMDTWWTWLEDNVGSEGIAKLHGRQLMAKVLINFCSKAGGQDIYRYITRTRVDQLINSITSKSAGHQVLVMDFKVDVNGKLYRKQIRRHKKVHNEEYRELVPIEDWYDVIKHHHAKIDHRKIQKTQIALARVNANITKEAICFYIKYLCEECSDRVEITDYLTPLPPVQLAQELPATSEPLPSTTPNELLQPPKLELNHDHL